jgi:serine/threonine-protein kinase HipA
MSEIIALLDGREVGRVQQLRGRLGFRYAESWRLAEGAYPLSISLPLSQAEHGHAPVAAFLWGLLPDNEIVLQRWARQFGVSPRNPYALIREVGEDCAGAVQFVSEDRLQDISAGTSDGIAWLTEDEVAMRLALLRDDAGAGRLAGDTGRFSLAGAQPKTALLFDGQRWGVPSGRIPTSHILKPALPDLVGHVENEHVCLNLARAFGLPAARSEARMFGNQQAIVIERYDRVDMRAMAAEAAARAAAQTVRAATVEAHADAAANVAGTAGFAAEAAAAAADAAMYAELAKTVLLYRVHQEDLCQALGLLPARKYQQDGGPGYAVLFDLLRSVVSAGRRPPDRHGSMRPASAVAEDVATFRDAFILNWLIGGTDAHAKNFSLLLGGRGLVRLAPLYDLATALVYPQIDPFRIRMAMSVGGEYRLEQIGPRHWRRFAAEARLDAAALMGRIAEMAAALPDLLSDEVRRARATGLGHTVLDRMMDVLAVRARLCAGPVGGT